MFALRQTQKNSRASGTKQQMETAAFHVHFVTGYQGSGKTFMIDWLLQHGFCALDFDDVIEDIIEIANSDDLPVSWICTQVREVVVTRIHEFRLRKAINHNLNHIVIGGLFDFASDNSYADFYDTICTNLQLIVDRPVVSHRWFIDVPFHTTLSNLIAREFTRDDHEENIVWRYQLATGTPEQAVRHTVKNLLTVLEEHEGMRYIAENTPGCQILPAHDIVNRIQETCAPAGGPLYGDDDEDLLDIMIQDFADRYDLKTSVKATAKTAVKAKGRARKKEKGVASSTKARCNTTIQAK